MRAIATSPGRRGRRRSPAWRLLAAWAVGVALVLALALPTGAAGAVSRPAAAASGGLRLARVEVVGNTRTATSVVVRQLGLAPGEAVTQPQLLAAVAALRERRLFASVDFYTRPGDARGDLVLVLEVAERGPQLRLGTGQSDLDGWYLIPLELSLDNAFGRGEEAAARLRIGYRFADFDAYYRRGTAPHDRWWWEVAADVRTTDRVYFAEQVEYAHQVEQGRLGFTVGRRLGDAWQLNLGVGAASARVDSTGRVWRDNDVQGAAEGDAVPYAALPAGIAAGVGEHRGGFVNLDLLLDTRRGQRAGSPAHGLWGRLRWRRTGDETAGDYASLSADLRSYHPAPGGVLALRLGAARVDAAAPFYDRLYLGGLYTVRGVPSQSLSAPAGGTWSWHGSLEYRAALVGAVARPRLVGSVFADVGQGGGPDASFALDDPTASVGWGLRYRLGRALWLGADFAAPLTDSPVNEAFHGHAALGWSF